MTHAFDPEHLLVDAAWLRRLATRLADDRDDADDLAQEAAVAAWRKRPEVRASLRPWLGKVVRDGARLLRRGRARRDARERAVAAGASARGADELLAEAQLHHALAAAVLALDEPFRRTILARFVDGQPAHVLARAEGVPAGTVRWRQAEALRRLRVALDEHAPRRAWVGLALGAALRRAPTTGRTIAVVVAVLAVVIALVGWGRGRGGGGGGGGRGAGPVVAPAPARRIGAEATPAAPAGVPATWTPAGPTTAVVAGEVIDERGAPIAGAAVTLNPAVVLDGEPAQRTITDRAGRFVIAPRWHESGVVTARADGYADAAVWVDPRGRRGAASDALVLVLRGCTNRVIGTVRDAGGGAIAGPRVRRALVGFAGRWGAATVGDGDGRFALCVPPGPSTIELGGPGYEHVVRELMVHGTQQVDVALVPEARFGGVVIDRQSGAPLPGAQVTLWPVARVAGGAVERSALCGADGRFTIDGLAAGRFQLTAQAADHVGLSVDDVAIAPAVDAPEQTLALVPATTARGVVTVDGAPLAGAEVWLEQRGGLPPIASAHALTAADGSFTLARVPAIAGLVPRIREHRVRAPATVDPRAGAALAIEVDAAVEVHGTVVRDGRPVPDAELSLGGPTIVARADGRGRFRLALAPGHYALAGWAPAVGAFTRTPVELTVPTAGDVTVELDGGGAIVGRVVDAAGQPLSGVRVVAQELASDDQGACTTAVDGSFVLDTLAGGRYALRVEAYRGAPTPLPWVGPAPAPVVVADGRARVAGLTLRVEPAPASVAGQVIDADGAPVPDAFVRLGPARDDGGAPLTRTDVDGRFALPTRGAGPFVVDAGLGGGVAAVARDVRPGQRGLRLVLELPGAIAGRCASDGATVWLTRTGGVDAGVTALAVRRAVVAGGEFRFAGVPAGDYQLAAVAAAGPVATAVVVVAAGATARPVLVAAPTARRGGVVRRLDTGAPVPGVVCVAAPALGELRPAGLGRLTEGAVTTDAAGRFTLAAAPAGPALVVCDGGLAFATGTAVVAASAPLDVAILPRPGRASLGFEFAAAQVPPIVGGLVAGRAPPGLRLGDRVVAVDGVDVRGVGAEVVAALIAGRPYGAVARLTVARAGDVATVDVTVAVPD